MYKRRYSLKVKCSLALLAAMVASVLFYYAANYTAEYLIEKYFVASVYNERQSEKAREELENYVSDEAVASGDMEKLNQWSRGHSLVYFAIKKEGRVTYSSYLTDIAAGDTEEEEQITQEETTYFESSKNAEQFNFEEMQFADGTCGVYLMGFFDYQFYTAANYISLGLAAFLFLLLFLLFLQREIRYVKLLESEVKTLEEGGMNKEITVKGSDELSELAFGLNQMRMNLNENIKAKEELLELNSNLVTGMARDLRTPLTALLLYTELLSKGKYKDQAELEQYLDKTAEKAVQIKRMSDRLFERFYIAMDSSAILEPPGKVISVMEGNLSDFVMFLGSQGFRVENRITWPEEKIAVAPEYMDRIFDNIASNLMKYGDIKESVSISLAVEKPAEGIMELDRSYVVLEIGNKIKIQNEGTDSTRLGVKNVKQMMGKMRGECRIQKDEENYVIRLMWPAAK